MPATPACPEKIPRFQRLDDWLERVGAKSLWQRQHDLSATDRLHLYSYAARGGSPFFVVVRHTRGRTPSGGWTPWSADGWSIYVLPIASNDIEKTFAAAEAALNLATNAA